MVLGPRLFNEVLIELQYSSLRRKYRIFVLQFQLILLFNFLTLEPRINRSSWKDVLQNSWVHAWRMVVLDQLYRRRIPRRGVLRSWILFGKVVYSYI